MCTTRDPYPFPKYQNDDNFIGKSSHQKMPYDVTTVDAQEQDPWKRLSQSATLSSARHESCNFDPQAPNDSLDFILKGQYDHHKEFLKGKSDTILQKETLGSDHGRILKNRYYVVPPAAFKEGHPVRIATVSNRKDRNSIKNAIEGHHTQTTNQGYSRKPDGGFFTS